MKVTRSAQVYTPLKSKRKSYSEEIAYQLFNIFLTKLPHESNKTKTQIKCKHFIFRF